MSTRYTPQRPLGDVLADAGQLYRAGFARCWPLSLLGAVLLAGAAHYWSAQVGGDAAPAGNLEDLDPAVALQALESYASPAALWAAAIVLVVALLVYSALTVQLHAISSGSESSSPLPALTAALRALPQGILAALLWTLALGAGLLLCIVPGIYWSGRLQFWLPAMLLDEPGAIGALRSSWLLTRDHWWRSNTALTLSLVVIAVLGLIADALASGAAGLAAAPLHSSARAVALSSALFDTLADVLLLPMVPAALLAIYSDLKQSQRRQPGGTDG